MNSLRNKNLFKNNENGYTLAIVLMVILVFSVLGMSVMGMSMNSAKMSAGEREDQSVFYVAESGAAVRMNEVEELVKTLSNSELINNEIEFFEELESEILSTKRIDTFEVNKSEAPVAEVKVELISINDASTEREYKIVSKGELGQRSRVVEGNFKINYKKGASIEIPQNIAMYSEGPVILTGSGTIHGKAMTAAGGIGSVKVIGGGMKLKDEIFIPQSEYSYEQVVQITNNGSKNAMLKNVVRYNEKYDFPLPPFPDVFPHNYKNMPDMDSNTGHGVIENNNININHYSVADYEIELNDNYEFNDITFNSSRKLTFKVDKPQSIIVNNITGSGHLYVEGEGSLTIYLKGNIDLNGNFNPDRIDNLFIFMGPSENPEDPKTLNSPGWGKFNASVYAKDANINLNGGTGFNGHIITGGKSVTISGGADATASGTVVYAPNAAVEVVGGGNLYGSVISKTFTMSGGTNIYGKNLQLEDIPYFDDMGSTSKEINLQKDTIIEK